MHEEVYVSTIAKSKKILPLRPWRQKQMTEDETEKEPKNYIDPSNGTIVLQSRPSYQLFPL